MRVEVLNTGDELLIGRCANSHVVYLGERLLEIGLRIARQTCVPDGEPVGEALGETVGRADVVIVTGGLGPTSDDVTREAAAALLGVSMHEDPGVVAAIGERLAVRGRKLTAEARRQALVPEGAEVIPNAYGTAPGLYIAARGGLPHLFLLPGPPREFRPLFDQHVFPRLAALRGDAVWPRLRHYKFFGLGESEVAAAVESELAAIGGMAHGFQVEVGNVNLRLQGIDAVLAAGDHVVRARLEEWIISDDGRSLEAVVVDLLRSRGETVTTAESCTGGAIAATLTDVPGSSVVFRRGLVTYANEAKIDLLGVDPGVLDRHGAVSEEVAAAMACGALGRSGDTHAIAVTGIAGPGGGSAEKPVGTVFIALASAGAGAPTVVRHRFDLERESFKVVVTKHALDLLRRRLRTAD